MSSGQARLQMGRIWSQKYKYRQVQRQKGEYTDGINAGFSKSTKATSAQTNHRSKDNATPSGLTHSQDPYNAPRQSLCEQSPTPTPSRLGATAGGFLATPPPAPCTPCAGPRPVPPQHAVSGGSPCAFCVGVVRSSPKILSPI